jgi:hypothetical protein
MKVCRRSRLKDWMTDFNHANVRHLTLLTEASWSYIPELKHVVAVINLWSLNHFTLSFLDVTFCCVCARASQLMVSWGVFEQWAGKHTRYPIPEIHKYFAFLMLRLVLFTFCMNSKMQMCRVDVQIPLRVDLRAETAHPSGGSAGENWYLRVVERPRRSEHRCRVSASSF